jgi:hypothetical protein
MLERVVWQTGEPRLRWCRERRHSTDVLRSALAPSPQSPRALLLGFAWAAEMLEHGHTAGPSHRCEQRGDGAPSYRLPTRQ